MTDRTTRQSTGPESSSSPQNKETTKSIMTSKVRNYFQKRTRKCSKYCQKCRLLDVKMNVINESMKENKQFLQKVIEDQNETIEKLTKEDRGRGSGGGTGRNKTFRT